jgi:phage-related holin
MKMLRIYGKAISELFDNAYAVLCGFFASILGYFLPVRDIVHLLILFFILDVLFGYWAARKLRYEKFSVKIIWEHTIPRMLLSIVIILGAYMWDSVFDQNVVCTYKIIGWFISEFCVLDSGKRIPYNKNGLYSRKYPK